MSIEPNDPDYGLPTKQTYVAISIGAAVLLALVLAAPKLSEMNDIRQAKADIALLLIDPESARFRSISVRNGAVCGQVDGKNRFNGYAGYQDFYYKPSSKSGGIYPSVIGVPNEIDKIEMERYRINAQPCLLPYTPD